MSHDEHPPRHESPSAETLREQAERELRASPRPADVDLRDPAALLHELQVHQIELEHQNEELRRALLEAEEARSRYLDLFDFAPIGYFTFDRHGVIQEVNLAASAMLGVSRERLGGRRFPVFVTPECRSHFASLLKRIFDSGEKRGVELTLLRPDAAPFWVQLEGTALDQGGYPARLCRMAMMDITVQKQVQQEVLSLNESLEARVEQRSAKVRELSDELERFTYDVATDLQGPLRHIQSFATLLGEQAGVQGGPGERYIANIQHSATRMQTLIAALLDFSRASRMRMKLTRVPLEQVLREVRKKLEPDLRGRQVRLTSGPLPVVQADSGAMQLVLRLLLDNALKFTREQPEPHIHVFSQDLPSEYVLVVRDNGVGFNMRYRDRLFHVFQRLHNERDYEGAGVGLAIVRRVASRYGGRVWADGKVGEGATFYVALPKQLVDVD